MLDPKEILTEVGMRRYTNHLCNIEEALNYIINHADDLHIGALDSKQEQTIYDMMKMVEGPTALLLVGDDEEPEFFPERFEHDGCDSE